MVEIRFWVVVPGFCCCLLLVLLTSVTQTQAEDALRRLSGSLQTGSWWPVAGRSLTRLRAAT